MLGTPHVNHVAMIQQHCVTKGITCDQCKHFGSYLLGLTFYLCISSPIKTKVFIFMQMKVHPTKMGDLLSILRQMCTVQSIDAGISSATFETACC